MATVNYAEKYASKVDERFTQASLTDAAVNKDYDFVGVSTVKVYSIPTVELGDYTLTGMNRYGSPTELGNKVQEMQLSQDKAFTFTIDRKSADDTMGAMEAGKALRREIDEVVIPTLDMYRLAKMVSGAGKTATGAITKENAYDAFLDGQNALLDAKIPAEGRVAFVSPKFYKAIKLDASFIKASDIAQNMLTNGSLGKVDGVNIVPVPGSYLPENTAFIIVHKSACCAPMKLSEYKTHTDVPGLSGTLVEGRIRHDAFVLNEKKNGIYVHKEA